MRTHSLFACLLSPAAASLLRRIGGILMKFTWHLHTKRANDNINSVGEWESSADERRVLPLSMLPLGRFYSNPNLYKFVDMFARLLRASLWGTVAMLSRWRKSVISVNWVGKKRKCFSSSQTQTQTSTCHNSCHCATAGCGCIIVALDYVAIRCRFCGEPQRLPNCQTACPTAFCCCCCPDSR